MFAFSGEAGQHSYLVFMPGNTPPPSRALREKGRRQQGGFYNHNPALGSCMSPEPSDTVHARSHHGLNSRPKRFPTSRGDPRPTQGVVCGPDCDSRQDLVPSRRRALLPRGRSDPRSPVHGEERAGLRGQGFLGRSRRVVPPNNQIVPLLQGRPARSLILPRVYRLTPRPRQGTTERLEWQLVEIEARLAGS